jgi:hypothetical protein
LTICAKQKDREEFMKAIMVNYDASCDSIVKADAAQEEAWTQVCDRYQGDVHRIRHVADQGIFSGLYECFDDDNKRFYFLVEEDKTLARIRRKQFLHKLGQEL